MTKIDGGCLANAQEALALFSKWHQNYTIEKHRDHILIPLFKPIGNTEIQLSMPYLGRKESTLSLELDIAMK